MPVRRDLVNRVRDILDEDVPAVWSDDQLIRWLNDGNRDLARFTHHYKSTATVPTVNGTAEYTLASTILAVELAYYDDGTRTIPLVPRHWESMDQVWGDRKDRTGVYPTYFTTWGYSPTLKLRVYPVPTSSTHNLRLMTCIIPVDLPSDDTTPIDVPTAWFDLLADYCEYKALRKDRVKEWKDAFDEYMRKREEMVVNADSLTVNREITPDPRSGYLPTWLVEFDW